MTNSIIGFPMSLLARQLALNAEGFLTRYACSWLVWEPSQWTPPESSADQSVVETRQDHRRNQPVKGDPQCFPLRKGDLLRIGRSAENELIISDATVSRWHVMLEKSGEQWQLSLAPEAGPTRVADEVVRAGKPVVLSSGDLVELGGAQLSFHDALAFKARLSRVSLRASGA